jgi:3-methyladenine DNA glycosylase AlkD
MTSYASDFLDFIQREAPEGTRNAVPHSYTGDTHIHYGLRVPEMRAFVKEWLKAHKATLTYDDWLATIDELYKSDSLEEKSFASNLLARFPKFRQQLPLAKMVEWLEELEGWAEVDSASYGNFSGKEMLDRWDEWEPFLREIAANANIHKRRASLVFLTKPIRETENDDRFFNLALEFIEQLKHEKHKLITKAISWVLRESIKQHRNAVAAYVEQNEDSLPAIARREFKKKLETGKK